MSPWTGKISSENSSASATTVCQYEPEYFEIGQFFLNTRFEASALPKVSPYERTDVIILFDDAGNILSPCPGELVHDITHTFHVRVI